MNYKEIIDNFYEYLRSIDSEITKLKISEHKWSLREIIGHLIDSASNNHQRIVRLQISDLLDFPQYDCEQWISIQKYNSFDWEFLVTLWYHYNGLILRIINGIDGEQLQNIWVKDEDNSITLEELIRQYYIHLEKHMEHFNKRLGELLI